MGMMMKMTAQQSLYDRKMIQLDLLAGLLTELLLQFLFPNYQINAANIPLILVSRSIVDFSYHTFVSKKASFGGTAMELYASIPVFLALYSWLNPGGNLPVHSILTIIVLFALARLTGWG